MASIQYVAKRDIVAKALSVDSNDLSAASADNSFNSSASDLSGLLQNDFILVSGFADPANNGWFQLSADSTVNKIPTTATTLVDEAAGPDVSIKGYEHGDGQQYELQFGLRVMNKIPVEDAVVNRSLSRLKETNFYTRGLTYEITTDLIDDINEKYWDEFFASVAAGENFVFDAHGTLALPNNPLTVCKVSVDSWQRFRNHRKHYASFVIELV